MSFVKKTSLFFFVKNNKIKSTLFVPKIVETKNPAVLFIHGWATGEKNYIKRAEGVAEKGAICLTFEMRGHGLSEGKLEEFSRADHLQDAIAAYDFLVLQKGVDKNRIGVCGVSYGGYLASILTTKRPILWLALKSPALYKDERFTEPTAKIIKENPKVFSQSGISAKDNLALQALSNFSGDVLLVESENDTVVTHETLTNYLEVLKNKKLTYKNIKNADHALSNEVWKNEFIAILSNWFAGKFLK